MLTNEILSNEIEIVIRSYWRLVCEDNRIEIAARGTVVIVAGGGRRIIIIITDWICDVNTAISTELSLAPFLTNSGLSF